MSLNAEVDTYSQVDTLGKSQIGLILKVYDGALKAFRAVGDCYRNEDYTGGYTELQKGRRFVMHLYTTLDFDRGEQVAANLGKLYAYIVNESDVIAGTKDVKRLDSVIDILENLRSAWVGIKEQGKADDLSTAIGDSPNEAPIQGFTTRA